MPALPFAFLLIAGAYFLRFYDNSRISAVEEEVAALKRRERVSGWGTYR